MLFLYILKIVTFDLNQSELLAGRGCLIGSQPTSSMDPIRLFWIQVRMGWICPYVGFCTVFKILNTSVFFFIFFLFLLVLVQQYLSSFNQVYDLFRQTMWRAYQAN